MRALTDGVTTGDGLRLATRAWLPAEDGAERAALLLVHGLGEHIGRYQALASELVRQGYAVHGYDQRGHGASEGPRAQVDRFERFVDDLGTVVARVRVAHAGRPLVLFGHSAGGVAALRAVQARAAVPDALVLSSPALHVGAGTPAWLRTLIRRLAGPFPDLPTKPVDHTALSRDSSVCEAYRRDPNVFQGPVKARVAAELVRAGEAALAEAGPLEVPLLTVHGREDRIAWAGASVELHRRLQAPDARLELYDDGPHELFNDPLRERVIGDVLAWLDERLPPAGGIAAERSPDGRRAVAQGAEPAVSAGPVDAQQ